MAGILAWAADVVGGAGDSDDEAAAERERATAMTPDTNIPDPHMQERRRLMLIPAISLTIGSLQYSLEKGAAKAEFTDRPPGLRKLKCEALKPIV
ncbi:putative FKBP-type peptidyl-prolyl cis-trans isomerase 7, chloroplastic [Hordeum vulgare]|nr:putative FKBP-type peptidyl-prolyl cis-trans isomerase 7, chloroplastic [Hordeum vulgare]